MCGSRVLGGTGCLALAVCMAVAVQHLFAGPTPEAAGLKLGAAGHRRPARQGMYTGGSTPGAGSRDPCPLEYSLGRHDR